MSTTAKAHTCFVIMPIGKENTDEYEYNMGVFNAIIRPAAEACGYTVRRADLSFQTGNIPRQIVTELAEADLVIADLSERNANVYFELGIRHVLHRCGTIHVVEESKALPFDVAQYRAIKYSTHFTRIRSAQDAIQQAIHDKEVGTKESDNPVHDTLALPASYSDSSSHDLRERVTTLQAELAQVRDEYEALKERAALSSPDFQDLDEGKAEAAIDHAIDRSLQEINNSPAEIILQMRELADSGQEKELLETMRAALKSPYLEPGHIAAMAALAQQRRLRFVQNAVLEVGHLRFPGDVDFKRWLAESYVHSSDVGLKRKGLHLLEEHLGIAWDGDKVEIRKPFVDFAPASLAIVTDHYHENEQYDRELALLQQAQTVWPNESRVLRNIARTYRGMGNWAKADEYYKKAIEADPGDDLAMAWYSQMMAKQGRLDEAFEMLKSAAATDPDDIDYPLAIAAFVLEHGTKEQRQGSAPLTKRELVTAAIPLFNHASEKANNDPRIRLRIAEVLGQVDVEAARVFLPPDRPEQLAVLAGRVVQQQPINGFLKQPEPKVIN